MENYKDCPHCGANNWGKSDDARNGSARKKCLSCKKRIVEHKILIDSDIETAVTETKTIQYQDNKAPVLSAFDSNNKVMDIDAYCKHHGLPRDDVRSYKLVTHTGTPFYNIAFNERLTETEFLTKEFIKSIVAKHIKPVKQVKTFTYPTNTITRLVYTDAHIGMHPDPTGISIYGGVWNKEVQDIRFSQMMLCVDMHTESIGGTLIIDELGDYPDGWDGQTVRKGHSLPQNMSNEETFDQCVSLKVKQVDLMVSCGKFKKIILNNICNDNHAGAFGYVINSAVKMIVETKYPGIVRVANHMSFINHYQIGNHTFIISHGKDKENLKFGFKPKLDDAGEKKIRNYIDEKRLDGFIEFSKGDSHQLLLDYATSDRFDYMNYMSFAPPSQWVQTNYQKGRSGYVIQLFNEDKRDKIIIPKFF